MKSRGEKELEELENVFKALAHASRRHILVVLNARGGTMTAGEIAGRFSCSWPTTTRHLRLLQDAGLINMKRQGREWVYVLNTECFTGVINRWVGWFNAESKNNIGKEIESET